jgi:hypothetical protein
MASPDDLRFIFTSKAAEVLPPVAQDLVDALGVDDPADIDAVGDALARAFMQGTAIGATEMVAQAAEKGIHIGLNWIGGHTEP